MTDRELESRLNAETARIRWHALERLFARGVLVSVGASLDLVEVAAAVARDDKASVQAWLAAGLMERTEAEDARRWSAADAELWCVVVAPWVLVQEERRP